ncbi:MAG: hypothetical protein RIF37_09435 [Rhodospirillaceae bacterium]
MTCWTRTITAWTFAASLFLYSPASIAVAQQPSDPLATPDWGDYPLLMSQFGELCTMCEAYVRCTPNADQEISSKLYYFKNKTFWGQIATIWFYFAKWFAPITNEGRPAAIYTFSPDGSAESMMPAEAYLDVAESKIEIGGTWIDRDTNTWFALDNTTLGQCVRLGIPESMKAIEDAAPWQIKAKMADATQ